MHVTRMLKSVGLPAVAAMAALLNTGCPVPSDPDDPQALYDEGFLDGHAEDDWYWTGYYDGWDTVDESSFYQGDTIPDVESPPYDSGYYDGVWYAYHDGYFVDYKFAFVVGFSEGYDNAFWPDYLEFLDSDQHLEYRHGGWIDGYHDGYSEGRVFGAYDFEAALPFDWLDALLDYESGTDLYFEEIDVGTGVYGPVELYVYGTDPFTLKRADRKAMASRGTIPAIRVEKGEKVIDPNSLELYRPLLTEVEQDLDVLFAESLRSPIEITLTTTWLERIEDYLFYAAKDRSASARTKRTPPEPE